MSHRFKEKKKEKKDLHNKILIEVTGSLKKATESKNMTDIPMAQLMFVGVNTIATEVNDKKNSLERLQKSIQKRMSKIISELLNNKL